MRLKLKLTVHLIPYRSPFRRPVLRRANVIRINRSTWRPARKKAA